MKAAAATRLTLETVDLLSSSTFTPYGQMKVKESGDKFEFEIAGFTLAIHYDDQPHLAPGNLVLRSSYSKIKEATFRIPDDGHINDRLKTEIRTFFVYHRKLVEPIEEFSRFQNSYFK